MSNDTDDDKIIGINVKQILNRLENRAMNAIIDSNLGMTYTQKQQFNATLQVFEKHNIGAIEAFEIITELTKVWNE